MDRERSAELRAVETMPQQRDREGRNTREPTTRRALADYESRGTRIAGAGGYNTVVAVGRAGRLAEGAKPSY
jgi:hypothetical protein